MMPMAWNTVALNHRGVPWWRWLLIVVAALLLIACQGPDPQMTDLQQPPVVASPTHARSLAADQPAAHRSLSDRARPDHAVRSSRVPPTERGNRRVPVQPTSVIAPGLAGTNPTQPAREGAGAARKEAFGPPASGSPKVDSRNSTQARSPESSRATHPPATVPSQTPSHEPRDPRWCPHGEPRGSWRPPGLSWPWPEDEYLCDGGDKIPSVRVRKDWSVDGLALEDTVVHYDTLDGDTEVEPTNRVCIYSPRFASVRKVQDVRQHNQLDGLAKVDQPLGIDGLSKDQLARTGVQPLQPVLGRGATRARGFRERTPPVGLENHEGLVGMHGKTLPHEDVTGLKDEQLTNTEKARLAAKMQAAATWSGDMAVQVAIDNIATHMDVKNTSVGAFHEYSLEGKPRLRVRKLASATAVKPGGTVEFTLKFENVGEQPIGNVTVMDNLTTRLEYVQESQTSTLEADFLTSENEGGAQTLRWEIKDPMDVGEGGVIRFTCRVR
ncbi:MAG: hypothetical protein ACODAD_08650 [Planctomycetota bacterium]